MNDNAPALVNGTAPAAVNGAIPATANGSIHTVPVRPGPIFLPPTHAEQPLVLRTWAGWDYVPLGFWRCREAEMNAERNLIRHFMARDVARIEKKIDQMMFSAIAVRFESAANIAASH